MGADIVGCAAPSYSLMDGTGKPGSWRLWALANILFCVLIMVIFGHPDGLMRLIVWRDFFLQVVFGIQ